MILHILFTSGIIISIVGWFLDRANKFQWLMLKISPDSVYALMALDDLTKDTKISLTQKHKGFNPLLKKWPDLKNKSRIEYIGRSVAFMSFGPEVKNDIQLITYDKDQKKIENVWSISEARCSFQNMSENKLFKMGTALFGFGLAITVISYIMGINKDS